MRAGRKPTSNSQKIRGVRLGAKLRAARERRGLSQQQLSELADVAYATVRKIEAGTTPNPGFFTVADIASVLDIPLQDLTRRPGRPRRR